MFELGRSPSYNEYVIIAFVMIFASEVVMCKCHRMLYHADGIKCTNGLVRRTCHFGKSPKFDYGTNHNVLLLYLLQTNLIGVVILFLFEKTNQIIAPYFEHSMSVL